MGGRDRLLIRCAPEWKEVVQQVYEVDPDALEIMQLDLAVDVEAIPIQWFRSHMRYKPNGHFREIGKFDYISGPVETFYLRQKPTFIRVYDKDAETLHRTGSALGRTVTRIEKAYGTGAVPEEIGTLGALRESATKINPFKGIEFAPGGLPSPRIEDHDPDVWALGMGVRAAIEAEGYDRAWNMLNRSKKAGEIFAIAADFIPASEFVPPCSHSNSEVDHA